MSASVPSVPLPAPVADFVEWDVENWSAALDFWRGNTSHDLSQCRALEIGARHGGLSLWLAMQGAHVVCSDVGGPSDAARRKHSEAGVAHLIEYREIDATKIPYTDSFDIVVFKSVLGAVGGASGKDGQARAIDQMRRALKSDGELFFAENLVASPMHTFARNAFVPWARRWRYMRVKEVLDFMSGFAEVNYRTIGFAAAFGRGARQQNLLGKLDQLVLQRMVPERWRYIMAGVACR